jgi:glycerol-3-phosphate cytidylyltransferase-like family protein
MMRVYTDMVADLFHRGHVEFLSTPHHHGFSALQNSGVTDV